MVEQSMLWECKTQAVTITCTGKLHVLREINALLLNSKTMRVCENMKRNNRNYGYSVAPVWRLIHVPRAWLQTVNLESLHHSSQKPSRAAQQHHCSLTILEKNKLCLS